LASPIQSETVAYEWSICRDICENAGFSRRKHRNTPKLLA
jgi:hypothetical protein